MVTASTAMSGHEGGVLQLTPSLQPDEQHGAGNEDAVLKLKGLPYSTTEAQIYEFFVDYKVKTVAFVSEPDGRPSGLAFAEFESKEEALKALSRNGEYIGERYVRLLHVPKSEMEEQVRLGTLAIPGAAAKLRARLLRNQMQQARLAGGGYLAAPPLLVPTAQVLMQAGGPGRHLLAMHPQHAAVGQANSLLAGATAGYATPTNSMDTRLWHNYAAAPLLHQQFGGLSLGVEPTPVSRTRVPAFAQLSPHMQPTASGSLTPSGTGPAQAAIIQPSLSSSGASSYLAGSSAGALSNGAAAHHLSGADTHLPGRHTAHSNGTTLLGAGSGMTLGHANARGAAAPFAPTGGASPGGGLMLGGYGLPMSNAGMHALSGSVGSVGSVGGPSVAARASPLSTTSATVKVRGLPYRGSPADILGFFSGYQYLPDSLQLGLDASGRPSGEAWLSFASPAEASRAVRELNRHYLGTRYLELSVC